MYFRFGSAVCLVVAISLVGIAIEKQSLDLRRQLSRQHYQMDALQEEHSKLRLKSQELAAVDLLFQAVEEDATGEVMPPLRRPVEEPANPATARRKTLLFWQQPLNDPRRKVNAP